MTDDAALDLIARLLDGNEWGPSDVEEIARIVRTTGRRIRDVVDEHEVRPDGPETEKGGLIGQQPY